MTREQSHQERIIDGAHKGLLSAKTRTEKLAYWQIMVGGILGRDPEVTERLEAERKARVGI